MIDYKYTDLFWNGSFDKQWKIEYDGGIITNESLFSQSIELTESLCSESELTFGACEASCLKFKIGNVVQSLLGKWLTVGVSLNHHEDEPLMVGKFKVQSDKLTSDRQHREITAYDTMYDIINADVAAWYNSVLPAETSTMTLKQFRESFVRYFGLTEVVPDGGLVNDNMMIEKTIDIVASSTTEFETGQVSVMGESLSGLDVISAICEINGCFGHIGRDGKFHYIYLPQAIQGLWPANDLYPADDLFPIEPKTSRIGGGTYIKIDYENFITKKITKLQIRQEENDIGVIYGNGDNCYIIENNFLVYGKSSEELRTIAKNIYDKITGITYMPLISCEAVGNPCFEVGDPVRMSTKYDLIETYILERTLTGIQGLRDTYKSNGVEEYSEKVNGIHSSVLQLKGKANILSRTIEETKLTIINVENGLQTQIMQNAEDISVEAKRATDAEGELSGKIDVTAEKISAEVSAIEEGQQELSARMELTVKSITMQVNNGEKTAGIIIKVENENGEESELTGTIEMTGMVTFKNLENSGETKINGDNITTGKLVSLIIDNGNGTFHVDENGNVIMKECDVNGKITGREGFYTEYTNTNNKPNTKHEFQFLKAGFEDSNPYLAIKSPGGNEVIKCGYKYYLTNTNSNKVYAVDTPMFYNGIYAENAVISTLFQDWKEHETITDESGNWVKVYSRKSGAFVCIYGRYGTKSHSAGTSVSFPLKLENDTSPTHHSVKTIGYSGKRVFAFGLTQTGELQARNIGESISTTTDVEITFRFDYFLF